MTEKIRSVQDLNALRDKARAEIDVRTGPGDIQLTVHMGTCGIAAGARDILTELTEELSRVSASHVTLRQTACAGLCDQEPMMTVKDKTNREFRYGKLDRFKVHEIVRQHVVGGRPVVDYLVKS